MSNRFATPIGVLAVCVTLVPQPGWAQPKESQSTAADPFPVNSVCVNDAMGLTLTVLERKGETFRGKLVIGDADGAFAIEAEQAAILVDVGRACLE